MKMRMATTAMVAAVVTMMMMMMIVSTTDGQLVKTDVTIYNFLDGGLDLYVHCKSKDDDLGKHLLSSKQRWGFRFGPNVFENTLFFCSFDWAGNPDGLSYFDIYKQKRDEKLCGTDCIWLVHQTGVCLFKPSSNGYYTTCFPYNKKLS